MSPRPWPTLVSLVLWSALGACSAGGASPDQQPAPAEDSDPTATEPSETDAGDPEPSETDAGDPEPSETDAGDPEPVDTDPVPSADPLQLNGAWAGTLFLELHTVGQLGGDPYDQRQDCPDGTWAFTVDMAGDPDLNLTALVCDVELGTVTMTGVVQVGDDGRPALQGDLIPVSGTLTSTQFGGALSWTGAFRDTDGDGDIDDFQVSVGPSVVQAIQSPIGELVTQLSVSATALRAAP